MADIVLAKFSNVFPWQNIFYHDLICTGIYSKEYNWQLVKTDLVTARRWCDCPIASVSTLKNMGKWHTTAKLEPMIQKQNQNITKLCPYFMGHSTQF